MPSAGGVPEGSDAGSARRARQARSEPLAPLTPTPRFRSPRNIFGRSDQTGRTAAVDKRSRNPRTPFSAAFGPAISSPNQRRCAEPCRCGPVSRDPGGHPIARARASPRDIVTLDTPQDRHLMSAWNDLSGPRRAVGLRADEVPTFAHRRPTSPVGVVGPAAAPETRCLPRAQYIDCAIPLPG